MTNGTIDQYTAVELVSISDSLKRLAAVATQNPAPQSSVQIEQAAKGPPRVCVKTYAADVDEAAAIAQRTYDALVARYAALATS